MLFRSPLEEVPDIEPGEVYLYGPGENTVYLKKDGSVEIRGSRVSGTGELSVDGQLTVNGRPYAPCDC